MVELSFCVFPNLEDHRVEVIANPSDGAVLKREIRALVRIVRMKKNFLRFVEADSAPWIPPKTLALPLIEVESHDGITVIP
jgi:hypothetical protein